MTQTTAALWLLHIAALGQTIFVAVWLALPWWRAWVGRALMIKSVALMLMLDSLLAHHYLPDYAAEGWTRTGLLALVTLGIWSQVAAIGWEMRRPKS